LQNTPKNVFTIITELVDDCPQISVIAD